MSTLKQVSNKQLISLSDGKKVGEIKDLYLDDTLHKITGVFLGSGGLISRKNLAIDRPSIQLMGIDAWLVVDSNVVVPPEELPATATYIPFNEIRGREIVSEGGTQIGAVEDVVFDRSGEVLGFTLGKIQVKGTLADRKAIARAAISTVGGKTAAMTANMTQAESMEISATLE